MTQERDDYMRRQETEHDIIRMRDKPTAAKAKRMLLGVDIPRDELALRIAGKCLGLTPPPSTNPADALNQMNMTRGAGGVPMGEGFRSAADAAVIYFHECINAARQPS